MAIVYIPVEVSDEQIAGLLSSPVAEVVAPVEVALEVVPAEVPVVAPVDSVDAPVVSDAPAAV